MKSFTLSTNPDGTISSTVDGLPVEPDSLEMATVLLRVAEFVNSQSEKLGG